MSLMRGGMSSLGGMVSREETLDRPLPFSTFLVGVVFCFLRLVLLVFLFYIPFAKICIFIFPFFFFTLISFCACIRVCYVSFHSHLT
ncbi:hypothetical protein DFH27DRAFT_567505 [Peziza echinospora]|nr:hypothetical protein DFH27DRAFT_567505 [Peziza echinospora]